jgi:ribonuclease HI
VPSALATGGRHAGRRPVSAPRGGAVSPPRIPPRAPGTVDVHFDGACERLGGSRVAAYGYSLEGAGLQHEEFGLAVPPGDPRATNNVAEYVGAIRALEWLAGHAFSGAVRLCGDSQLVVRQLRGEYRVLAEHLEPYHERLRRLVGRFADVEVVWVPREENRRADALSKLGLERGRGAAARAPD